MNQNNLKKHPENQITTLKENFLEPNYRNIQETVRDTVAVTQMVSRLHGKHIYKVMTLIAPNSFLEGSICVNLDGSEGREIKLNQYNY